MYYGYQNQLVTIVAELMGKCVIDDTLSNRLAFFSQIWYNEVSASSVRKEVELMEYIVSLIISVMAGVICHYISKWLDRK